MVNTFHNDCNINLHSPKVQLTGQIKIRLADFNLSILCHLLTRMSAVKSPADVFAPQKLEVQKLARTPIFEPHHLQKLFRNTQKAHFRHGWRVDKTMTSFHKNNIFVKTRKVMGNTDVAHYRGQLATTLSSFCSAKTRSSAMYKEVHCWTASVDKAILIGEAQNRCNAKPF